MNLILTSLYHAGDITCISWAPTTIPMGKSPSLHSICELPTRFSTFLLLSPIQLHALAYIPESSMMEASLFFRRISELNSVWPHPTRCIASPIRAACAGQRLENSG